MVSFGMKQLHDVMTVRLRIGAYPHGNLGNNADKAAKLGIDIAFSKTDSKMDAKPSAFGDVFLEISNAAEVWVRESG